MLPTTMRILVCTERQDMRRSFDALVTRELLEWLSICRAQDGSF
jgi:hypothetical protein